MKKIIVTSLLIGSLVAVPNLANAASNPGTKPAIKGAAAKGTEGTAAHEQGESAGTQKAEDRKTGVKVHKKVVVKKKKK